MEIYGKYDWTDRFYYWLYKIKKGNKFILPESGEHKLSLTYATDLVNIILKLLESNIKNEIYNCSTHPPMALKEMLHCIAIELNVKPNNFNIDIPQEWLLENNVKPQNDLPFWFGGHLMFSNEKIEKDLNLKFTSFKTSVKNTIEFYNETKWNKPTVGLNQDDELKIIDKFYK